MARACKSSTPLLRPRDEDGWEFEGSLGSVMRPESTINQQSTLMSSSNEPVPDNHNRSLSSTHPLRSCWGKARWEGEKLVREGRASSHSETVSEAKQEKQSILSRVTGSAVSEVF